MIEQLSTKLIYAPELPIILFGLMATVAVATWIIDHSQTTLLRAPYFALTFLVTLAYNCVVLTWVLMPEALVGGYMWVLALLGFASTVAFTYAIMRIANARSRDAFGSKKWALLTFIPIANLWLLLRPSKSEQHDEPPQALKFLYGDSGVIVGFVAAVPMVVTGFLAEPWMTSRMAARENDPVFQAASIDALLLTQGVEATIKTMAGEPLDVKIDEMTTLTSIRANAGEMQRTFEVSDPSAVLTAESKQESIDFVCSYEPLSKLLQAGGTIREVYLGPDKSVMGDYTITVESCVD